MRTLYEAGKLSNAVQEMKRLKLNILGISESRWTNSGRSTTGDFTIYYSGNNDNQHQHGVAIVLSNKISSAVTTFVPYSDRIIMVQLQAKPINVNIIQIYAPTADKDDDEIEGFYEHLKSILRHTKKHEINILMGDFNSKVNLAIMNTFFKLPLRRLYTWKSPQDNSQKVVRNQVDFLLVNKRFKNSIQNVKTYPGADIGSDHNPLIGTIKLQLKFIHRKKITKSVDVIKLKTEETSRSVQKDLETKLNLLKNQDKPVEALWTRARDVLITTAKTHLQSSERTQKQQWMTDEILDLMDERRRNKVVN